MKILPIGPQDALDALEPCFDGLIQHHVNNTPGAFPWLLMKAQCWQESRFNPLAVSPTGPVGLYQFTRPTWIEWSMPGDDRRDVFRATGAAVRYMARLGAWVRTNSVTGEQVPRFALACYNQGQGNVRKAMEMCAVQGADPLQWGNIPHCLLPIIGPNRTEEVVGYVNAITERWAKYQAEGKP